jgi:hypothetical protein
MNQNNIIQLKIIRYEKAILMFNTFFWFFYR